MVKVINKQTRRKARKVYVSLTDSHTRKSRGFTLEGVTVSQAFAAISTLGRAPQQSGTDSIGAQGCAKNNNN